MQNDKESLSISGHTFIETNLSYRCDKVAYQRIIMSFLIKGGKSFCLELVCFGRDGVGEGEWIHIVHLDEGDAISSDSELYWMGRGRMVFPPTPKPFMRSIFMVLGSCFILFLAPSKLGWLKTGIRKNCKLVTMEQPYCSSKTSPSLNANRD